MATNSLHSLINGDSFIIEYYQNAKSIWANIKSSDSFATVELLAKELSERQCQFENECGGRYLGQEIMATFGIGQFYTMELGFDADYEEVVKVYEAFNRSYCSVEVKLL